MLLYDALVNTLISGGLKGCYEHSYVNTLLFSRLYYKSSTVECGTGGAIELLFEQ
jgi:hypothetical protein